MEDLKAAKLRNEGNWLFQQGEVTASLDKYSQALRLGALDWFFLLIFFFKKYNNIYKNCFLSAPDDHLTASNRSHAYYRSELYDEALEDANRSIEIKPDWGKSYFIKGMVLAARGNK